MSVNFFEESLFDFANRIKQDPDQAKNVYESLVSQAKLKGEKLNCFVDLKTQSIEAQLSTQVSRLKAGEELPLACVPVAIKDNICSEDDRTSCGSKILETFKSPFDATVVKKLRDAGAIVFGKANCDEFAMGSSNENSAYGAVKNPWDLNRVPGGSSGGSAASVAGGIVPAALGSDTGGSIRQPASFCGIVGLKPTYGRVSRYGLVAFGSSLDQIGPFTISVKDSAMILEKTAGFDLKDSTTSNQKVPSYVRDIETKVKKDGLSLKGMRLGYVREFFGEGLEDSTRTCVMDSLEVFRSLGASIVELSLPTLKYSLATYYVVSTAEASANLARFDGVRYGMRVEHPGSGLKDLYQETRSAGFGREVKQRIMLGTFVLSSGYYDAYYGKAQKVRRLIQKEFQEAFAKVDLLVSPTVPYAAFQIGEKSDDPLAMYLSDICTVGVNLAGIPAMALPCGFTDKGLPVGLQLMGHHFGEGKIFEGAFAYEQSTKWWQKHRPKF